MQKDNQRRLLLLLKLLYEQTDETHFVSGADILRYWEDAGIRANRKNVYGDIRLLLDAGHDILRHTYITNLLLKGVDIKTVQYLAGHERAKITLDIYAHLTYNRPEEIIEKIIWLLLLVQLRGIDTFSKKSLELAYDSC